MCSGRNDLTLEGKKISGHAYHMQGDFCYHHGTLMVDVDIDKLGGYLNVSKEKLQSKGVASVRSRVTNLKEYVPDITIESLKTKLIEAFEEEYGGKVQKMTDFSAYQQELKTNTEKYQSWDWS